MHQSGGQASSTPVSTAVLPWRLDGPFVFDSTVVAGRRVSLRYRVGDGTTFTEVVEYPFDLPDTHSVRVAVRLLHLVAGVSYYKTVAPATLVVGGLTGAEKALVEGLYDEGLREMAYRNGLTVPLPVEIVAGDDEAASTTAPSDPVGDATPEVRTGSGGGALVPIGGGKDSALVAALVPDGELFAVNPVGAQRHLAEVLGRPLTAVTRTLDPQLRELNERGVQNGHVPVTAVNAALAVLAAAALGVPDVLMGIERSADEPTVVTADGVPVNHQFSKSARAERLLREAFAPTGVRYLSLLRPLTELAIGFGVVSAGLAGDIVSCNRVFTVWNENRSSQQQRPCGDCAKCLFTALMMAPASDPASVEAGFGRRLLDEEGHVEAVRDLWSTEKPFECVGERLETAAAVSLLARQDAWRHQAVPAALAREAAAMLADAGVDPASFLEVGSVEDLPEEYRDRVVALRSILVVPEGGS